jgi:hypothetical protein
MCIRSVSIFTASITVLALGSVPAVAQMSDEEMIKNAMSAAPDAVGKNATVVSWEMKELQKGTNGFTCFPDDTNTPTNDPMCVDENGLAWVHALMAKTAPPEGKIGFGYMLQGETAASNVDPFAAPPADGKWSEAGPHVMIFNAKDAMAGYVRPGESPDPTQPYVMWEGTPYEHLMIPTE